ncbi:MAG: glutamate 5-kinase [Succinivibrio sp.]|nr:glutamate 5-kinase [Succinivibrio sp.]
MNHKRIVIKLGTSTLTGGERCLDRQRMLEIVRAIYQLREMGHQVVLVSSGAQALGREVLSFPKLPPLMSSKQLLASVGQSKLMEVWENLFAIYKIHIGQLLLTRADLEDRERYLNARDTLLALLEYQVLPVINENDAVAVSEIKVGDNDNLAALTALLCDADQVILLTDQKGLYTQDPRQHPEAELIRRVEKLDAGIFALAGGSGTQLGTGGMQTKLKAAQLTTSAGIELVIASGANPVQLPLLVAGQGEATFFSASQHPREAKKNWILEAARVQGRLNVDKGARRALQEQGSSLLPKGILSVSGDFLRGGSVEICDEEGRPFARGISRYSSEELTRIRGHHSQEIEELLHYTHGDVAVHRDELVLF